MSADLDMSSDDEAEMLANRFRGVQEADPDPKEPAERSKEALNPWTIARFNAPSRPFVAQEPHPNNNSQATLRPSTPGPGPINHPEELVRPAEDEMPDIELPILRPRGGGPPGDLDRTRTQRLNMRHMNHTQSAVPGGAFCSPTISPEFAQTPPGVESVVPQELCSPPPSFRGSGRRKLPSQRPSRSNADIGVDPDGLIQSRLSFSGRPSQKRRTRQSQLSMGDVSRQTNTPFEAPSGNINNNFPPTSRKRREVSRREQSDDEPFSNIIRDETPQVPPNADLSRPDARATEWVETQRHQPTRTPLLQRESIDTPFDGDSRAYLMRRQRSTADAQKRGRKPLRRIKTDRLPLETVPGEDETQDLVQTIAPDAEKLAHAFENMAAIDNYIVTGCLQTSLDADMGSKDVSEVEVRLRDIVSTWTQVAMGEKMDVDIDLLSLIKGKGPATAN